MTDQIKQLDTSHIQLTGALNFNTVPLLQQQLIPILSSVNSIALDLSRVSFCDSSGVALMLACLRLAKQMNKPICFNHIPVQMQGIAHANGVAELFNQ